MPKISPFKAYRFQSLNAQIKENVCPPYDVISPPLEEKLRKKKNNAIQIELPKGSISEKYKNAKKAWQRWVGNGVVAQDLSDSFYLYEQTFKVQSKSFSRRGFFCALELEEPGKGSVLRHELTLSKPKEDRMRLLESLNVNTSPIFGIFKDPKKTAVKILSKISKTRPQVQFTDTDQVTHKLWTLEDLMEIKKLQEIIRKSSVLIADGHHRYETAWSYSKDHPTLSEAASTLFFLSPAQDHGLVIFPTHRILLSKGKNKKGKDLCQEFLLKIKNHNDVFEYKEITNLNRFFPTISPKAFMISDGKTHFLIQSKSLKNLKKQLPGKSIPSLEHPLVQIHSFLLPNLKKEDFLYVHRLEEAIQLAKKHKTLTLLIPPTSIEHMHRIVFQGEVMPQKSTYFYPKIISGLLFRSLI